MSNIPENQEPIKEEEEFSTIFSDPTEHRKSAENVSKKKNWPKAVAAILAAVVLIAGTVLVVKLIPEKEDDTTSSVGLEPITVADKDSDDFKTVTVTNKNGTFKFYSVDESEDGASYKTINWYLEGYEKDLLSTAATNNAPDAVASISASRKITQKTAVECGLENPSIKVDVVTNNDEEFSVLLGAESPDKTGYYLKLSTSDNIYLVESTMVDDLTFDALSFANTDAIPAIPITDEFTKYGTDGKLTSFDKLIVLGKDYSEPIVITPNTDELTSQYLPYKIVSPINRIAQNLDEVFALFSNGLSVNGAYSYSVDEKALKEFGFDDPDFIATVVLGDKTIAYMFALQEDGNYAVVSDLSRLIKKVSADSVPFVTNKETDFYGTWVCFNSIGDVKKLTFKTPEKEYAFGIKTEKDEDDVTTYTITYDGKVIDTESFQSVYQECISLNCSEFTVDKLETEPEYVITFDFIDSIGGSNVIEFTKSSATKYQFRADGNDVGKITSASLNKLMKSVKELVE